ncbi:phage major capsid protein, P2 family [Altericroceibacterium endophyticum]|uniref:Phage major capsid protein, P2 family n=1 Tax=Altericroceibacterium endophyticum TaxID=1808508 RepID=A0A6I4T6D9_9SPHN|nr:phage major capsid protein, P2 family [Altericroceibacterium endophyticum]MXO66238.1 phage major capsid protein, P2 family [Altericroceibacterium endophyticum]
MRPETRERFNAYCDNIAEINQVGSATTKFSVEPSIQQRLINRKQESSEFLSRVNIVPVPELSGEVLGLGISGPVTSNTDTSGGRRREPTNPNTMDGVGYQCRKNNQDTMLRYDWLDLWAKFPDFEQRIQRNIIQRQALDTIMIGLNGTHWSADTDLATYPSLEDVNVGWLQKLRNDKPEHVLDEGERVAGKVTYGPGGDYATLDALVYDAINNLLPSWARRDTSLRAVVSWDLLNDKYFPLINAEREPTEELARDVIMSSKRLGNRQADEVPYMPEGTIMVTRYDNLSIYEQEGKRRRHIKDEPEVDRIADYQSSNDAYAIEDYDFACLIENIEYAA